MLQTVGLSPLGDPRQHKGDNASRSSKTSLRASGWSPKPSRFYLFITSDHVGSFPVDKLDFLLESMAVGFIIIFRIKGRMRKFIFS